MIMLIYILSRFLFYISLYAIIYLLFVLFLIWKRRKSNGTTVISFLHPFCNDCGGGEKVLWMMVQALKEYRVNNPSSNFKIKILSGIKDNVKSIMNNLENRFDIKLGENKNIDIEVVRLKKAHLLKPRKLMTMILQIFGQVIFAFEVLTKIHSDYVIDTTGLPFTYWVFSLIGRSNVIAYVHYPFISNIMIEDIQRGLEGVHSRGILSKIPGMKIIKEYYYKVIFHLYKWNGRFVNFQMSNSTWTYEHMTNIWPQVKSAKLFPPCSTELYRSTTDAQMRANIIVSFAQFRPEKRHKMQVDIFKKVVNKYPNMKLHIVGSTRDPSDQALFDELQGYINQLGLGNDVILRPNLPFVEVKKLFSNAKLGIHTMRDEHFGISIIEMMSAGLVTIAHNSAGPKSDIIGAAKNCVGILADSKIKF